MNRFYLLLLYPLLLLGLAFTALRYVFAVIGSPAKAWNVALLIDELCNVDANGRVNQTISARAALARDAGRSWGCWLCALLDKIQPGHCANALRGSGGTQ